MTILIAALLLALGVALLYRGRGYWAWLVRRGVGGGGGGGLPGSLPCGRGRVGDACTCGGGR